MLWNEKPPSRAKQLASCILKVCAQNVLTVMIICCELHFLFFIFLFSWFMQTTKIFLQWKFPDLRYLCICTGHAIAYTCTGEILIVLSSNISFYLFACREMYSQLHYMIGQWTTLIYTLIFPGGCVMHRLVVPVLKCHHCNLCNLLCGCCNLCDEWDIVMEMTEVVK